MEILNIVCVKCGGQLRRRTGKFNEIIAFYCNDPICSLYLIHQEGTNNRFPSELKFKKDKYNYIDEDGYLGASSKGKKVL